MKDRLQELNGMCLMLAAALFGVIVALVVSVEDVKKTAIITPLVIALFRHSVSVPFAMAKMGSMGYFSRTRATYFGEW